MIMNGICMHKPKHKHTHKYTYTQIACVYFFQ